MQNFFSRSSVWALVLSVCTGSTGFAAIDLTTHAEKSGWKETGRYEETARLCRDFARAYPAKVKCETYGTSPEGRRLLAVIVNGGKGAPVVWAQAGIHAGEIDGKDAVFALLKDSLAKKDDLLKGVTLVFIPIVNPDGHERFGPNNRPNQVGPTEMGWRTTAQNLNLNRDFAKADSPEMRALNAYWGKWDPTASADLHVTNGAQFQPEVGVVVATADRGPPKLQEVSKTLETDLVRILGEKGRMALPFYPELEKDDDPSGGFGRYVPTPRFAHGYWASRNRIGILVESHSWKDYATRVKTHRAVVETLLELAKKNARDWAVAEMQADVLHHSLAGKTVDLEFKTGKQSRMIEFPGYEYKREKSKISGDMAIRYFPDKPQTWKVPFFDQIEPKLQVRAPLDGYYVPAPWAERILPALQAHRIVFERLKEPRQLDGESFRADTAEFSKNSFEGRQTLKLAGAWRTESQQLAAGSLFIPIKQKYGRLVLQLFEPACADSFAAWGFFNAAFEKKEYMENYVAEEVAAQMLQEADIRKEFEEKLKDQAFAGNAGERLDFFYRKHVSYDQRYRLYPVYRK